MPSTQTPREVKPSTPSTGTLHPKTTPTADAKPGYPTKAPAQVDPKMQTKPEVVAKAADEKRPVVDAKAAGKPA